MERYSKGVHSLNCPCMQLWIDVGDGSCRWQLWGFLSFEKVTKIINLSLLYRHQHELFTIYSRSPDFDMQHIICCTSNVDTLEWAGSWWSHQNNSQLLNPSPNYLLLKMGGRVFNCRFCVFGHFVNAMIRRKRANFQ